MKKYMVVLLVFTFVATSCFAGKYDYYFDMITPSTNSVLGRLVAPFQAGYFYTDEQKEAARKRIVELKKEQKMVRDSNRFIPDKDRLKEIENKIYEQQLITGEAWSMQRKAALATVALLGASALSFGLYRYIHQAPQDTTKQDFISKSREGSAVKDMNSSHQLSLSEAERIAEGIPYSSPDLTDPNDLVAVKKRLDLIKEQQQVKIGNLVVDNPNFNTEDLRVAEKQYNNLLQRIEFEKAAAGLGVTDLSLDDLKSLYTANKNIKKIDDLAKRLRIEVKLPPELSGSAADRLAYSQRALDYVHSLEKDRRIELLTNPNSGVKQVSVPLTWYEWTWLNYYSQPVVR